MSKYVGTKTVFEATCERDNRDYRSGWLIRARITHFELHPTKGYRRTGRQYATKWLENKPKSFHEGQNYAEIVRMGRNLKPLAPADIAQARLVS
jgi:hypothetical protein